MAKRPAASPPTTRKRAASKKPNGDARSPVATAAPPRPSEEDIRVRAYHRYLERGAGDGSDFDDWLEAEKDLKSSR
jgi:hypothetical protein